MPVNVKILPSADLQRVTRNLGRFAEGRDLRRRMTKEMRDGVRPVRDQVRAAYRSAPSTNQPNAGGRGDLRKLLARATVIQVKVSGRNPTVSLKVDGRKMPEGMGHIPAMWEGRIPWKHPVFDRDQWVRQRPRPTFDRIVPRSAPRVRARVVKAAEDAAHKITEGN